MSTAAAVQKVEKSIEKKVKIYEYVKINYYQKFKISFEHLKMWCEYKNEFEHGFYLNYIRMSNSNLTGLTFFTVAYINYVAKTDLNKI